MPPSFSILPFLRPMSAARASGFRPLLRFSTTSAPKSDIPVSRAQLDEVSQSDPAPTSTIEPSTLEASPSPSSSSEPAPTSPRHQLSWHVSRTASGFLPVYSSAKRGGNLKQTRVRKISGEIHVLRDLLKGLLRVPDANIEINSVNKHIIIKGMHTKAIKEFLEQKKM